MLYLDKVKAYGISLFLLLFLFLIQGCGDDSNARYYRRLNQQLQTAATTVNAAAEEQIHKLERKLQEHGSYQPRNMKLYSLMLDINAKAKKIHGLADDAKAAIMKESGEDPYAGSKGPVRKHLRDNGLAKKIWQYFTQLKILTDSLTINILPEDKTLKLGIDSIKTEEAFIQNYFTDVPAGEALVNLSSLQHDAAEANYFAARFVQLNMGETAISFSTIDVNINITQSARQAKPGETIKVTADIRDFTLRSEPRVTVGDQPVNAEKGIASIEIKAAGNDLQTIPVVVHFKKKDGVPDSIVRTVVYKVMDATKP